MNYTAAMKSVKEDLCAKHAEETKMLTQQIVQLEACLAQLLQEQQQHQLEEGRGSFQEEHRVAEVVGVFQHWALSMKESLIALVKGLWEFVMSKSSTTLAYVARHFLHLSMSKSDDTKYCRGTLTKSKLVDMRYLSMSTLLVPPVTVVMSS